MRVFGEAEGAEGPGRQGDGPEAEKSTGGYLRACLPSL